MRITLIGAGHVATHLGKALYAAGHRIEQVWSRSIANAEVLAQQLDAEGISAMADLHGGADVYLLSVVDDALPALIAQFPYRDKVLCHTAGSVPMALLEGKANAYGVFYPLQTFSKTKELDFKAIPLFVEGSDKPTQELLLALAQSLSDQVSVASSEQRKYLHIAAVFACNFSNYMYAIAEDLLVANGLPFDAIRPLIVETAEKAQVFSPKNVQTGPAIRDDQQTMRAHLDLLSRSPELAQLYETISKRIGEDLA